MGGLFWGYLYIRYGFHVAVLAHWGVDYLGSVFYFMSQGGSSAAWTSSFGNFFALLVALTSTTLSGSPASSS